VRYVDEALELKTRLERVCTATTGIEIPDGVVEFWGNYIPRIYGLAKALPAVYEADNDAAAAWDDRMMVLYEYSGVAGLSWTAPYLAGMYALACQAKPNITPQEFLKLAMKTGRTIQIQHDGKSYSYGTILDPQALIAALQE